jgi:hypothetical protein
VEIIKLNLVLNNAQQRCIRPIMPHKSNLSSDTGTHTTMKLSLGFLTLFAVLSGIIALAPPTPKKAIEATQDPDLNAALGSQLLNDSFDIPKFHNPSINTFHAGCDIQKPTAQLWKEYLPAIKDFVNTNIKNFTEAKKINESSPNSFPIYLGGKYASATAPSSLHCDSLGECSIGSCHNLDDHLSQQVRSSHFEVSAIFRTRCS